MVRYWIRKSTQASSTRRRLSTPARWPAKRGSPRWRAQRPFPSMIMATCLGMRSGRGFFAELPGELEAALLDLKDLPLFSLASFIDLFDVVVRQFLQLPLASLQFVPSFFGQRRYGETDHLAVAVGSQAQV